MKKILVASLLLIGSAVHASAAVTIGDHLMISLLQHVTAVEEDTFDGKIKAAFLDSIVQIGHYRGDYLLAIDAGVVNSVNPDSNGKLAGTVGAHLHVISALAAGLNVNPSLKAALKLLELNPRWSYDADVHHGVFAVTFGARIPFE